MMALYFEMRRLPWFKAKWKKSLDNPKRFLCYEYALLMVQLIYRHVSRFKKQQ